ncbi:MULTISPECIES: hypothetical protein [Planococcus]|uniref:ABC transporter permease n=1 Tax=Planococcus faecalis TaxID=1598147 RepID=A0ABN4XRZ2_9BACL|nr:MULTISPECIES: hypothetical protein [Planococcus]AQU79559.1 hypothetical protein AJGP001_09940 [Planococcus faecalis]MDJ0333433.1 hypothetical protein [Planococcus sp. S3-L1]OHX53177.1 hypothetical protein BB777_10990 [Planococcus faecalis]
MKNLLLLEWRKVKYPVLIVAALCTALSIYLCSTVYQNYALEEQLEAWEVGMRIFSLIFPLIAVLPTGWMMYYERKTGFINYTLPRASKKDYLTAKWIVMSGSAFLMIFIPFFVGVLVVLFINNPIDVFYSRVNPDTGLGEPYVATNHIFGSLFTEQPLIYGFLMSVWKGLLAVLIASMGFVFSLHFSNLFIILTGPFVYTILENFILSVLPFEGYRLLTAFDPSSVLTTSLSPFSFIVGPALALITILGISFYMQYVKKSSIYSL